MGEPLLPIPHAGEHSTHRPRRREKGKERARDPLAELSTSSKAGPSKPKPKKQGQVTPWDCIPVARSEVSAIPPVWSKDGRFYFTAANTSVFVHSSTAPKFARLSTLSSTDPHGHRKPITALLLHPTNPLQLLTSSEDGTIKIWDWVEGRHVRTIVLAEDGKVNQICVSQVGDKWWIFGTVTNPKPGKKVRDDDGHLQHRVMRVPLLPQAPSTSDKPVAYLYLVGKLRSQPAAIMISPRSNYIVALAGSKAYVYRLPSTVTDDKWKLNCVKFVSDETFTCGAFAPDRKSRSGTAQEEWFATGDEKGVIRLWHGLDAAFRQLDAAAVEAQQAELSERPLYADTEKRLPTTSLHWHAHAVAAIAFTSAGAQILSVGEESVLVQWHLASGKREYIPRLGGRPILNVAVRPGSRGVEEEFWMGFADGALMRVGASTGHVSAVGQGVRLDPLRPTSNRPYPLAIHPATKALVVPSSHPSTLQFIDPLASTVLFDLEVAPSNRVSKRDDKELEPVAVEQVAFSEPRDGRSEWMATVVGRRGDSHEGGGYVKTLTFWRWNGERYVVNTQYPRPHGVDNVTSLAFGPAPSQGGEPFALTASSSGTVKLWHVRQVKKSEQGKTSAKKPAVLEYYWSNRSTFSYRSLGVHAAAFSPDATIVALAHGPVVTLWDAQSNLLLRTLESSVDARKVAFSGAEGRFLVVGGAHNGVAVWDLLSCEVVQLLPSKPVDVLLPLPSGFIAAQSAPDSTTLAFFSENGKPGRTATLKAGFTVMTPLPLTANVHLVGIASSGEISRFGDLQTSAAPAARNVASAAGPARRATSIWQEMFGKDAFLDDMDLAPEPEAAATAVSALQRGAAGHPEQVFNGPSHTLPPVSLLFDAFMDEFLGSKDEAAAAHVEAIEIDEVPSLGPAPISITAESVRAVRDDDVAQLEVFFRDLTSSAPPKQAKPAPLPKAAVSGKKSKVNGLGVPNGGGAKENRSVSTPSKPRKSLDAATATPDDDGRKAKSKKRKARVSEV